MKLILASQSPRRRLLLENEKFEFEVCPPDDDAETAAERQATQLSNPVELVRSLAIAKAKNVTAKLMAESRRNWILIAADTVADLNGKVLGKPKDRVDAKRMLEELNGRIHLVHTAICLCNDEQREAVDVSTTQLRMDELTSNQIEAYLATEKWVGKAGAFGYQDGWDWLHVIEGEESNVVGLPMELLKKRLSEFGF